MLEARFQIGLHKKDIAILELIRNYFGGGNILKQGKDSVQYRVYFQDSVNLIIPHFDKYQLITHKRIDYELFKQVVNLMKNKEHLTMEGLHKIVTIRASINLG